MCVVTVLWCLLWLADELLVERVVGRRSDPETGKIYHLKYSPPPADVPLERLVHRSDDTEDKIKVRPERRERDQHQQQHRGMGRHRQADWQRVGGCFGISAWAERR